MKRLICEGFAKLRDVVCKNKVWFVVPATIVLSVMIVVWLVDIHIHYENSVEDGVFGDVEETLIVVQFSAESGTEFARFTTSRDGDNDEKAYIHCMPVDNLEKLPPGMEGCLWYDDGLEREDGHSKLGIWWAGEYGLGDSVAASFKNDGEEKEVYTLTILNTRKSEKEKKPFRFDIKFEEYEGNSEQWEITITSDATEGFFRGGFSNYDNDFLIELDGDNKAFEVSGGPTSNPLCGNYAVRGAKSVVIYVNKNDEIALESLRKLSLKPKAFEMKPSYEAKITLSVWGVSINTFDMFKFTQGEDVKGSFKDNGDVKFNKLEENDLKIVLDGYASEVVRVIKGSDYELLGESFLGRLRLLILCNFYVLGVSVVIKIAQCWFKKIKQKESKSNGKSE